MDCNEITTTDRVLFLQVVSMKSANIPLKGLISHLTNVEEDLINRSDNLFTPLRFISMSKRFLKVIQDANARFFSIEDLNRSSDGILITGSIIAVCYEKRIDTAILEIG